MRFEWHADGDIVLVVGQNANFVENHLLQSVKLKLVIS